MSVHSAAFLPYIESVFEEVFKLLEVSWLVGKMDGTMAVLTLHH